MDRLALPCFTPLLIFEAMMLSDELNRFDRTLAILILLQSKKLVKAQDMADRFAVSLRTIYRDIKSLEAAGVPILGEAGSGYSIMEGYRLPPVMFTREEAGSFVAAEKLMQKFTDAGLGRYFETAINKVKAVLKGQEKDWIAVLEKKVWAEPSTELFSKEVPNALEILFTSIAEQQQVLLRYLAVNANKAEQRSVEPVGVFHENNYWYLLAYCHLRNDYRQFRTDRIQGIQRTTTAFTRKHGNIDELRKKEPVTQRLTRVVIVVNKSIARYLDHEKKYHGFVSQEQQDDTIEMLFMTASLEGFVRWYMMFGDHARIVEPAALKDAAVHLMQKIRHNLDA